MSDEPGGPARVRECVPRRGESTSGSRGTTSPTITRRPTAETDRDRTVGFPTPTSKEAGTIVSVPLVLLATHFLIQPLVGSWARLGYVRYGVARRASPSRVAPEPFAGYAQWWHELTRLTHALVHDPSDSVHVVGNVALLVVASWLLLVALAALDVRRWFAYVYWEVVVVAPVVGSYAFDLFGETPRGYGASTVGYAVLGVVLIAGLVALVESLCRPPLRSSATSSSVRSGGASPIRPLAVICVLVVAAGVVSLDLLGGTPATPVHQAGVGYGVLVGTVFVSVARTRGGIWTPLRA